MNGKAGFDEKTAYVCNGKHYRLNHGVDPKKDPAGPRPHCKGSTSKGQGGGYNCHKDWGFVVMNGKRWWFVFRSARPLLEMQSSHMFVATCMQVPQL